MHPGNQASAGVTRVAPGPPGLCSCLSAARHARTPGSTGSGGPPRSAHHTPQRRGVPRRPPHEDARVGTARRRPAAALPWLPRRRMNLMRQVSKDPAAPLTGSPSARDPAMTLAQVRTTPRPAHITITALGTVVPARHARRARRPPGPAGRVVSEGRPAQRGGTFIRPAAGRAAATIAGLMRMGHQQVAVVLDQNLTCQFPQRGPGRWPTLVQPEHQRLDRGEVRAEPVHADQVLAVERRGRQ